MWCLLCVLVRLRAWQVVMMGGALGLCRYGEVDIAALLDDEDEAEVGVVLLPLCFS
jgi:hypothetical protein